MGFERCSPTEVKKMIFHIIFILRPETGTYKYLAYVQEHSSWLCNLVTFEL